MTLKKYNCKEESSSIGLKKYWSPAWICQSCGDKILHSYEECEVNVEGCDTDCTSKTGWDCSLGTSC